jgi:hypothetical protein
MTFALFPEKGYAEKKGKKFLHPMDALQLKLELVKPK